MTGVSVPKGGQDQTLFERRRSKARKNPGENPGRNPGTQRARGKANPKPQNQGRPAQPPGRGEPALLDRRRGDVCHRSRPQVRRATRIDLDEVRRRLAIPSVADRNDWEQIRKRVREVVGDSTFEIWLEPLQLIAIDPVGVLVIAAPATTNSWVETRFGRLLARSGEQESRAVRFADEPERQAFGREDRAPSSAVRAVHINQREVS